MPVYDSLVGAKTPMGATLVGGGATFRTWAPNARDVYVVTDAASTANWSTWTPNDSDRLFPQPDGTWAGFVPDIGEGSPYLFWVRGPEGGSEGFKRDPHARELGVEPAFPDCPCLVRNPRTYQWRAVDWQPPPFNDMIIYQLHIGTFWAVDEDGVDQRRRYGRFLDVIERVPYLRDLGVNAVQFLPIQEYDREFGLGYNGLDYFSPEMAYQFEQDHEIARHLERINAMLTGHGLRPVDLDELRPGPNQLKCLVDLCHIHGLAVIFDVVYNHAGGGFGDRSLHFFDRRPWGDDNLSLYFTDRGWAGGKVFAYWQSRIREFLIANAQFFVDDYRIDGLRYDEVTVIHHHGGDAFCRELTNTLHAHAPRVIHIAEYWDWDRGWPVTTTQAGGLGFDASLADGLRESLRAVLAQASQGREAYVALAGVRDTLYRAAGFPDAWRMVNHLENHDVVRWDYGSERARAPRVPAVADPSDARSWHARSRTRAVTTLLLTAPGIPMLFMGQEILEDKPWHDDVENWSRFLIWWDGFLSRDRHMRDFHRFMTDLIGLRRDRAALRGEGIRVSQTHDLDRVIVVHRWVEGVGDDVVVVVSLDETTRDYTIELPWPGRWVEIFNSDYYDHHPNPLVAGNGGSVHADGPAGTTYGQTARMRLPANGALVLARG